MTTFWHFARAHKKICLVVVSTLLVTLIASMHPFQTPSSRAETSAPPPENVVFYYQDIAPDDVSKFDGAYAVVTANQGGTSAEREAVDVIHQAGARALRYVNFYWYPNNRTYQGIKIRDHPGWKFCGRDKKPIVGRRLNGERWYFIDANERAARDAIVAYLKELRTDYGYDGVFFDRGGASLLGANDGGDNIAWRKSTCTKNKVITTRRRTFSDVFVGLLKAAREKVFTESDDLILMNFGKAPYTKPKVRPDPLDPDCRARKWKRCNYRGDVWRWVTRVIDEAPSNARAKSFWRDYRENRLSERHRARVIGQIKVKYWNRGKVYYRWSRARLFRLSLFVNTGDDGCAGGGECWRYGTYPELTDVRLGGAIDDGPRRLRCAAGSRTRCLWVRRYERGMVVVNVSAGKKRVTQSLGVGSRLVTDVYNARLLSSTCTNAIDKTIPRWAGRVYVYDTCG